MPAGTADRPLLEQSTVPSEQEQGLGQPSLELAITAIATSHSIANTAENRAMAGAIVRTSTAAACAQLWKMAEEPRSGAGDHDQERQRDASAPPTSLPRFVPCASTAAAVSIYSPHAPESAWLADTVESGGGRSTQSSTAVQLTATGQVRHAHVRQGVEIFSNCRDCSCLPRPLRSGCSRPKPTVQHKASWSQARGNVASKGRGESAGDGGQPHTSLRL